MRDRVLYVDNVTFGYTKERMIYKDFSLELYEGEIKSIVGSSGSGKSTLFALICKELEPLSGKIEAKKLSQIFQDPYSSFHPSYNLIEQIEDVATFSNTELESVLDRLSLKKELIFKKPHQLSGGQLQRASILRALLMKPKLLLADEPTSALDNIIQLEVMKILVSLLDSISILLITHDISLAKWCSDEIIDISKL
jgi:peptide/nickel transport system ATP-binding protein